MATKKVQDLDTGEIHLVAVPKRSEDLNPGGFVMVWQEALEDLLSKKRDDAMTHLEWRTWLHLLAQASFGNEVEFYVTDLANELERDRSDVGRAVRELKRLDLLRPLVEKRGRVRRYLLNPDVSFRGKNKQRSAARKVWMSLTL